MNNTNTDLDNIVREVANQERKSISNDDREAWKNYLITEPSISQQHPQSAQTVPQQAIQNEY